MPAAPLPANEAERMARLRALNLLDSPPEALFEGFARTAAAICDVPIAAISLIDSNRQWFKAQVGLGDLRETPRDVSFCAHAILDAALMQVPDARDDPRFHGNSLVEGEPRIRFYAGVPLELAGGLRVGALCAIDRYPKKLTQGQTLALQALAQTVSQALLLRDPAQWSAAEEALLHSERKYRQLAEFSPFGVCYGDALGNVEYSNDQLREVFGVDSHEALTSGWTDAVHPQDRQAALDGWKLSVATGRDHDSSYRVRRPDGEYRHVRDTARATRDTNGVVTGWVGVVDDVTDKLRIEQQLREEFLERESLLRRTNELRELLAERDAMIDVLAHEVRQPLNSAAVALQAASTVLGRNCKGTAKHDVQRARQVLAAVIDGVNNTLAVSTALMSGELVQVDTDVDMLLNIVVGDMQETERARIRIQRETLVRTVWADVGLMRMALRNLVANALRYSPSQAPVVICVSDALAPAALNIDVIDQGGGIAAELMPRLFERGTRSDAAPYSSGHGLGLFIARRAMELQKGAAQVLRSNTEGTVMRLQLCEV